MKDTTASITRSAKRFFSGTILSRITGMFRDMALAFAFGTEATLAAFMVAFRFAHLLRRLLGEGALQTAFIPHFEELRTQSSERAFKFFRDLYASLSLILFVVIILIVFGLSLMLQLNTFSSGTIEILFLTLLMMPSLFFICLFGLNASLLQCEKSYFTPSVAPVAFNVIWILGVALIAWTQTHAAMPWMSLIVIIACLCQWLMTLPQVIQKLKNHHIAWKQINFASRDLRALATPLFCGVIGIAATQVNNALDPLFARYADSEGPAFLWYASRLQQLPLALFGIALSGALLPPLSRAMKNGDNMAFKRFLDFASSRTVTLMLPISCYLFLIGDSCINLVYGHGNFQNHSIINTSECLWAYTVGLIPMSLVLILAPAFYAQGNYRTPTIASTLSVVMNIGLNTLFIFGFNWGSASVALATSFSSWFNFLYLAVALKQSSGSLVTTHFSTNTIKIVTASLCGIVAVFFLRLNIFHDDALWNMWRGIPATFATGFMNQMLALTMQSLTFGSAFLIACLCMKAEAPWHRIPEMS